MVIVSLRTLVKELAFDLSHRNKFKPESFSNSFNATLIVSLLSQVKVKNMLTYKFESNTSKDVGHLVIRFSPDVLSVRAASINRIISLIDVMLH